MSVRGERVVYRERDSEWEEAPRTKYTTVKRYQVPEAVTRSSVYRGEDEVTEDKIIIRRERKEDPPPTPKEDVEYRFSERVTERERSPKRDISYRVIERDSDHDHHSHYSSRHSTAPRSEFRVVERDREVARAPSPPSPERVREFRFERERDFSPPHSHHSHRDERPYDLERYSKSTEYFAQPQPQPIIIREPAPQPIIIREERREPREIVIRREEPHYEFVEREEVKEQSLVKREEPPPPAVPDPPPAASHVSEKAPEEDYFYERRVIERSREPRRREEEVLPKDSASQYSSDDSYEYVRRERVVDGDRDHSPHHKRHLAEGALAGIAAGEIIRHHKKSQGEKPPGRGRSLVGGAALGAVGAEALSRVRSMRRGSGSRSRSGSRDRDRDRRRDDRKKKHRSRSRDKSLSRVQQFGGLAAVAAVGALAGYAIKNAGKNKETVVIKNERRPRRSRSRRRRASADSYMMDAVRNDDEALNPNHRNRRIAQAGLASAAAAGIWEKVRSRSRGAKGRNRSQSRLRQGVPIAAAGLGGAALAGLYEKNKAGKEAKKEAIIEDELNRGRRRRSRSRSRSAPAPYYPYPDEDRRAVDDRGLIAYGNEPIYPHSARSYYSDEEPGNYRRRHRGGSESDSSPDTRRRTSRSRSRGGRRLAEAGAAAGVAAVTAHEIGRRRERSEREQHGTEEYAYRQAPYGQNSNAGYGNQPYPSSHYFPPPPTGENARDEPGALDPDQQNPYPAYNPADYAQSANQNQPYGQQPYGQYGDSEATLGAPYPNDTFAGDQRYDTPGTGGAGVGHDAHGGHGGERRGRSPENVSAPPNVFSHETGNALVSPEEREAQDDAADGINTSRPARARSASRVRFDLASNTEHSPEILRKGEPRSSITQHDTNDSLEQRERKHRHRRKKKHQQVHQDGEPQLMHDKYKRGPDGNDSDSDGTVDLPPRFDEQGNRRPEAGGDPLADKINELLSGHGGLGGILGGLLGNGESGNKDGGNNDDEGRSGRRRSRR